MTWAASSSTATAAAGAAAAAAPRPHHRPLSLPPQGFLLDGELPSGDVSPASNAPMGEPVVSLQLSDLKAIALEALATDDMVIDTAS